MNWLKPIFILLVFSVFFSCTSDQNEPISEPELEPEHFALDEVLDHLPFDQFNEYSTAIFVDSNGKPMAFRLAIEEDVIESFTTENHYSYNQITFRYSTGFDFESINLIVIATLKDLPELGLTEMLICRTSNLLSSIVVNKLEIIPGTNYKHTILNEEFSWMDKTFENVYSNILIEENTSDNVKIFYQSPTGIIGFNDNIGKSWIFDRFE